MNYRAIEITFENYLDAGYEPILLMFNPKHKERMNIFVSWDVIDDNTWTLHTVYGDCPCRFDYHIGVNVAIVLVNRSPRMPENDPLPPHLTPRGTVIKI